MVRGVVVRVASNRCHKIGSSGNPLTCHGRHWTQSVRSSERTRVWLQNKVKGKRRPGQQVTIFVSLLPPRSVRRIYSRTRRLSPNLSFRI